MNRFRIPLGKLTKKHYRLPFHAILHPVDAIETIKYAKIGSYRICAAILAVWMLSEVLVRKNIGFVFSTSNPDLVNINDILSGTLAIFLILSVSNYLLCTFMEGEGTYKQIFCFMSYLTLILIIKNIGTIILTSILTIEMASFFTLYSAIFYVWCALYILAGITAVHQFAIGKSVLNIVLTVVGAAIIIGLLFLLYSLFQQVASFFYTIYNELSFRT
jgi:hypothetical protein